jgi:hypothetical protein
VTAEAAERSKMVLVSASSRVVLDRPVLLTASAAYAGPPNPFERANFSAPLLLVLHTPSLSALTGRERDEVKTLVNLGYSRFADVWLTAGTHDFGARLVQTPPRAGVDDEGLAGLPDAVNRCAARSRLRAGFDWERLVESANGRDRVLDAYAGAMMTAVADVVDALAERDRGQLLMACGTGKTLTALWITEALGAIRTLVLVPSLSLLEQTLREWLAEASKPFPYLAVCSDETVVPEHDEPVPYVSDLGVPVTTEPDDVSEFLRRPGRRVVFATYHSSPVVADAQKARRVPRRRARRARPVVSGDRGREVLVAGPD